MPALSRLHEAAALAVLGALGAQDPSRTGPHDWQVARGGRSLDVALDMIGYDQLRKEQAEKEKTREIRESQRQILRETRRLQSRSSLKLGAALAGTAGLGVLLLFTQFMTLGLLAVSATGSAQ